MRSFKEFFEQQLQEASPPNARMGSPLKAGGMGTGLQTGSGINFPSMGIGAMPLTGPQSMGQWLQHYSKPHEAPEWKLLDSAARAAQNIGNAVSQGSKEWGSGAYVTGTPDRGGKIMNLQKDTLLHSGVARGYQFSPAELQWLQDKAIIIPDQANPQLVHLDMGKLYTMMLEKQRGQELKYGAAQAYDMIAGRMANGGPMSNAGTNLDPFGVR